MIVLSLTSCPHALRGDLTRWLFEVDTNLYVGKLSARVRDMIWERVTAHTKSGRAVMVFPTNNEQGFDFRVWGETWEPIDYNGLKLMLRPHPGSKVETVKLLPGSSNVEKRLASKRFANAKNRAPSLPDTYVVLDVETTGLSPNTDEIMEIGAIKVVKREVSDTFQALIRIQTTIPPHIEKLTGITNDTIVQDGNELLEVIRNFREFAKDLPIVSHNVTFDMSFLRNAYGRCGYAMPTNACIDTLRMARKLLDDPPDYKLATLMEYFRFDQVEHHRSLADCESTRLLFEKLRSISTSDGGMKVNENDGIE